MTVFKSEIISLTDQVLKKRIVYAEIGHYGPVSIQSDDLKFYRCQFHQHFTRTFLYESAFRSFSLITVWLCYSWQKNMGKKAAPNMLMKLATGWIGKHFSSGLRTRYNCRVGSR